MCDFFYFLGIRLVGQKSSHEGILQVFSEGRWGTVCDDKWDINLMNVRVACRQLGFPDGVSTYRAGYDPHQGSNAPIVMDEVDCMGNENNLLACRHGRGVHIDCSKHEDVGVNCKTGISQITRQGRRSGHMSYKKSLKKRANRQ